MTAILRVGARLLAGLVLLATITACASDEHPAASDPARTGPGTEAFDGSCWTLDDPPDNAGAAPADVTSGVLCVGELNDPTSDPTPIPLTRDQLALIQEHGDTRGSGDSPCRTGGLLVTLYGTTDDGQLADFRLPLCPADVVFCEQPPCETTSEPWVLTARARQLIYRLLREAGYLVRG